MSVEGISLCGNMERPLFHLDTIWGVVHSRLPSRNRTPHDRNCG